MTPAQIDLLYEASKSKEQPEPSSSDTKGTVTDLMMFSKMKVR